MAQDDLAVANGSGAAVRADLNANLQALGTLMSGSSAPSTTYPFMLWADTANDLLKQRNAANSAWIIKGTLSAEYGGLPASGISYAPGSPAQLSADNVQGAIDELANEVANVQSRIFFTKDYESSEQSITASSLLTLAHGLGARPTLTKIFIRCKTTEHGWAVGDEIEIAPANHNGVTYGGFTLGYDATNLYITTGNPLIALNKSTGAGVILTLANWRYIVRAWA